MKLNNIFCTAALAASALISVSAYAVPTVGTIPGTGLKDNAFVNSIFPGVPDVNNQIEGWYQAQLYATVGMTITVDYFGAEASLLNNFSAGGVSITHNGSVAGGFGTVTGNTVAYAGTSTFAVAAGLIPFSFLTGDSVVINNGSNPGNLIPFTANAFITLTSGGVGPFYGLDTAANGSTPAGGSVAWLFLDDGKGGPDDNHDDLIIRLTASVGGFKVPEPATLSLLGLGLLGMGALRRKRAI